MLSPKDIGERIELSRKRAGLSLNDVAQKMGFNKTTIMRYENGEVAKIKEPILDKLSEVLNVSSDYILGLEDEPQRKDSVNLVLSPIEKEIIIKYRQNQPMQEAVRRLLGIV